MSVRTIRAATVGEGATVADLYEWLFAEPGSPADGWRLDVAANRLENALAAERSTVLVATDVGALIGSPRCTWTSSRFGSANAHGWRILPSVLITAQPDSARRFSARPNNGLEIEAPPISNWSQGKLAETHIASMIVSFRARMLAVSSGSCEPTVVGSCRSRSPAIDALVYRFYDDLWNRWDDAAVDEVLAPTFEFRGSLGSTVHSRAGWRGYRDMIRAGSSDFHNTIVELVAAGDRAAARLEYSGTHTGALLGVEATGRQFSYPGAAFFTATADHLAGAWVLGDLVGLCAQLAGEPDCESESTSIDSRLRFRP